MKASKRVTTTWPIVSGEKDLRGSSLTDEDDGRTVDNDQGLPRHGRDSNRDTSPPRHLVSKLLDQNTRLKNFARQMIAERGLTVAQYLVRISVVFTLYFIVLHSLRLFLQIG